jgi:dihydrofolate reductase
MQNEINSSAELTQDLQDALRNLLDNEVALIGGGEVIVNFA